MDYVPITGPAAWLIAAIAACGAIAILAHERGWRTGVYVFKPLTTLLVIALAWRAGGHPAYSQLILAGLALSLVGDVFLMLPRDRFVAGLVSFLLAHLCYMAAFASASFRLDWWVALPLAVYSALLLRILLPHTGKLKIPVVVYAAALAAMAWLAVERAVAGLPGAGFAAAGALLFVASDSALALDRFRGRFRHAQALVLATYFAAQTLIAISVYYVHVI
ncbi:MAG TPA: lysoplasmalogenase [Longimicrobiaceae bacterium]|nr:lysoplasmalogenase [Longimicrobiaceae bacterium]